MTARPEKRRASDTHPLWLRVAVGLLGGFILGAVAIIQSGDALGAPISIAIGVLLMVMVVSIVVRSKKVWSVFRIFEGL